MKGRNQLSRLIHAELSKRHYSIKTIETYKSWILQLCDYYSSSDPDDITMKRIQEYVGILIDRRRLAPATVHQAVNAFKFFFNQLLQKKDYDIDSIPLPKKERPIPDLLSPNEVFTLLNSIVNLKHRLILSLIYSTGMDVSECVRLRVKDIDFKNRRISVRYARKKGSRSALLAESISNDLANYVQIHKPKKWLFESRSSSLHISVSTIQRGFQRALQTSGINKVTSVRSLRYSYVKHLEKQGYPLRTILQELGIFDTQSLAFYDQIDHVDVEITTSPIDFMFQSYEQRPPNLASLERMVQRLTNEDEKDYLLEAIICIKAEAYRAGVVLAWTAAIRNLQQRCMNHSLNTIDSLIKKHASKAPNFKRIDDFSYVNDRTTLEVCRELGELDKNEKGILIECLDLRNKCGHPGKYKPQPFRVSAFIEDLVSIVFS